MRISRIILVVYYTRFVAELLIRLYTPGNALRKLYQDVVLPSGGTIVPRGTTVCVNFFHISRQFPHVLLEAKRKEIFFLVSDIV
jgi:cytochrome P450